MRTELSNFDKGGCEGMCVKNKHFKSLSPKYFGIRTLKLAALTRLKTMLMFENAWKKCSRSRISNQRTETLK